VSSLVLILMPWEPGHLSGMLKRPFASSESEEQGDYKAPHVMFEGEEEWTCPKCGNLNYPGRKFCNMRRCQTMKPTPGLGANTMERWICPGCGNENYEGRLFCNMRKCGAAKPGLTAQDLARHPNGGGMGFAGGYSGPPVAPVNTSPHQGAPPGSWKCLACGNVNYPQRTQCNGQQGRCGQLRSVVDGGPPVLVCPQATPPQPPPITPYMVAPPRAGGGSGAPAGSWVCAMCKNVNYPTRTHCNARECGRPREEVDGGEPEGGDDGFNGGGDMMGMTSSAVRSAPGASGQDVPPAGSWVCPGCANVNWPTRTVCNKRACGLPRPT